ncbi:MAG: ATP-dependent metallopeptidase FtsH/Yme1/Tma family protein, partial [Candidatus Saccharicenans sp.]
MAKKNRSAKNLIFWIASLVILIILWSLFPSGPKIKELTFSEFLDRVEQKNVQEVTIQENQAQGKLKDGSLFKTTLPPQYADLIKILRENQVNIVVKDTSKSNWLAILLNWFPIILLIFSGSCLCARCRLVGKMPS